MTTAPRKHRPRRDPLVPPDPAAFVVGHEDRFAITDAPYHLEERVSASGRSYSVKVYDREAYTAAYMARSAESARLVRWAVRLSDGSVVSHDGLVRMRDPEAWNLVVKPRIAKLRGEAREVALAEVFWTSLSPAEREALLSSVDLDGYADSRGERQALRDLLADLRAGGSPLAFVDAKWWQRIRDRYAERHLGGPVGSSAWASAPWSRWMAYHHEREGLPMPVKTDPRTIEGVVRGPSRENPYVPASWWWSLAEYLSNATGPRVTEADFVAATLAERLGGVPSPIETGQFPSGSTVELRNRAAELRKERFSRMDRGLAASLLAHGASDWSLMTLASHEFLLSFSQWIGHAPSARAR